MSVNTVFLYMNLTHRWRKKPPNLGQKISIQGRKIVHSTLASEIEKNPQVLDNTYWKQGEVSGIP